MKAEAVRDIFGIGVRHMRNGTIRYRHSSERVEGRLSVNSLDEMGPAFV